MVRRADLMVKAIMIGLCFASLLTWTIFIAQFLEMIPQRRLRPYELLFQEQRRGEWRRSHSGRKIDALPITASEPARLQSARSVRRASNNHASSTCLRAGLRYGHTNKKFQGEDKWQGI